MTSRLDDIKQRLAAAAGKWNISPAVMLPVLTDVNGRVLAVVHDDDNAMLIANAPDDLRALLAVATAAVAINFDDFMGERSGWLVCNGCGASAEREPVHHKDGCRVAAFLQAVAALTTDDGSGEG